jgi:hypothetical protein
VGAAGQSAVAGQRIAGIPARTGPQQFPATDDKESAILHNFCQSVIFAFSGAVSGAFFAELAAIFRLSKRRSARCIHAPTERAFAT